MPRRLLTAPLAPLPRLQLGHGHFHDEGLLQLVDTIRHERVVSVAAGRAHSVALAADGKIFTWGDASRGQLGHAQLVAMMQGPNPQPLSIPFPQAIQSLEPARLRPPARVTAIAAGGDHSMAVTVAGSLLAFGCNKHGQVRCMLWLARYTLGIITGSPGCMPTSSSERASPAAFFDPSSCPRLLPALHPCCLQLGTGDTLDRLVPTEVPLALESEAGQLVRAMQVQCGAQHTLALVQVQGESQVRSVGGNSYGELGLGDRQERHRFHPIPGLRVSGGKGWARSCRAGFSRVWWRQNDGKAAMRDAWHDC